MTEKMRRETKFLLKQATIGNFKNFDALLLNQKNDSLQQKIVGSPHQPSFRNSQGSVSKEGAPIDFFLQIRGHKGTEFKSGAIKEASNLSEKSLSRQGSRLASKRYNSQETFSQKKSLKDKKESTDSLYSSDISSSNSVSKTDKV